MTIEKIRRILHEDAPFTIHLVSGRQFRVPHTDYAALGMNNSTLVFTDDTGSLELIRLSSIESLTPEKTANA